MKKIIFFGIFTLIAFVSKSQDIIIKKSGDEIKAKVLEIGISEIKYKRFDFQDGPDYTISKSEVVLVRYENGINEVITAPASNNPAVINTPAPTITVAPVLPPEKEITTIEYAYGSYNMNGRYISKTRVTSLLKATKDAQIERLLKKSKRAKVTGNLVGAAVGVPLIVIGSLVIIRGAILKSEFTSYNNYSDPDGTGLITAGSAMAGTGLMLQFVNIGFQARSKKKFNDALEIYNAKYAVK